MTSTIGLTLRDRWLNFRNRLLASPGFQRAALKLPFIRPFSRIRSRQLFDLVAGFVYSQILYTCVSLNLFHLLARGPLSADTIAHATGWSTSSITRLLQSAAALGLLQRYSGGRFGLGAHGAALMGNSWIAEFIRHHKVLYQDLCAPEALLKGETQDTGLRSYWAYARSKSPESLPADVAADYTALMGASQRAISDEILESYSFSRYRSLIDVGGGNGSFLIAVARRYPSLDLTLFDLPAVAAHARANLQKAGLLNRIRIAEGSFLSGPLPKNADIATLVRVVHDHDDDAVVRLMSNVRAMLTPRGHLVVAEPLAGLPQTAAATEAYFNMYFAAMGSGRTRTFEEIATLGESAAFTDARLVRTRNPLLASLVVLKT